MGGKIEDKENISSSTNNLHSWISAIGTAVVIFIFVYILQIVISKNNINILLTTNKTLATSALILLGLYLVIGTLSKFFTKLLPRNEEGTKLGILGLGMAGVHMLLYPFITEVSITTVTKDQPLSIGLGFAAMILLILGFLGLTKALSEKLGGRQRLYLDIFGYASFIFILIHVIFLSKLENLYTIGKILPGLIQQTELVFIAFFVGTLLILRGGVFILNKNRSSLQTKIIIQAVLSTIVIAATLGPYVAFTDLKEHQTEVFETNRHIADFVKTSLQKNSLEETYNLTQSLTEAAQSETTIFFLNSDKIVTQHPKEKEIGSLYTKIDNKYLTKDNFIWESQYKKSGNNYLDTAVDLGSGRGYVVVSADNKEIDNGIYRQSLLATGLVMAVTLISAIFSLLYLKKNLFNPVRNLTDASQKIAKGNFTTRAEVRGKDEVATLSKNFNEMASTIQSQIEELRKVDRLKDEFIAIASHNLRTPLTTLRGYLDQLDSGQVGKLTAQQHETLKKAQEGTTSLISLAEGLLNITTLESKEMKIDKEPVDLNQLINEMIEQAKIAANLKDIKIKNLIGDDDVTVIGDKTKLKQAFFSILDNAVKFNKKGGEIVIDKIIDQTNIPYIGRREIIVSIKDSGIGIKKEEQANIFKKFNRGTDTYDYEYKGVGLGLYLTRLIVLAHRGKIWFESEEGEGTTFYISLSMQ